MQITIISINTFMQTHSDGKTSIFFSYGGGVINAMLKWAVILVGGQGTRLGALTKQIPKPMLPVGGDFFWNTLTWNLSRYDIDEVILDLLFAGTTQTSVHEWLVLNGMIKKI